MRRIPMMLVAATCFAAAACSSRAEDERLEAIRDAERLERDENVAIAQRLDEHKDEAARLAENLGRARAAGAGVTPDDLKETVQRAVPKALVLAVPPDLAEISGDVRPGPGDPLADAWSAFDALGLAIFRSVRIADSRWTFVVEAPGLPPAADAEEELAPLDTGAACGSRCKLLREEIERLRRENAELERLVAEVKAFEGKKRQLMQALEMAGAMKSLPDVESNLKALFAGPKPLLASASISLGRTATWTLTGMTFAPGRSKADLTALPGWSIDALDEAKGTATLRPPPPGL